MTPEWQAGLAAGKESGKVWDVGKSAEEAWGTMELLSARRGDRSPTPDRLGGRA